MSSKFNSDSSKWLSISDKEWKEKKLNHYDNKILFDNNTEHFVMGDWE